VADVVNRTGTIRSCRRWSKISTKASTDMSTGDLNGNGKAEIIVNFASDNTTWFELHTSSPEAMAVGDINAP
jgi:hypothetical protein